MAEKTTTKSQTVTQGDLREVSSKKLRQQTFIDLFPTQRFEVMRTCKQIGISRKTYYRWIEEPEFKAAFLEALENKKDFVEGALMNIINKPDHTGHTTAVIFANKTLNKDRGYVERTEHAIAGKIEITFDKDDANL